MTNMQLIALTAELRKQSDIALEQLGQTKLCSELLRELIQTQGDLVTALAEGDFEEDTDGLPLAVDLSGRPIEYHGSLGDLSIPTDLSGKRIE